MVRFFIFILLVSQVSFSAVWEDQNSWSPEWESRYQAWVQSPEWNTQKFAGRTLANGQTNPYYGLKMDCADTVYTMRAIFAYENRLPFIIQDPTTVGKTISNKISRWDQQGQAERFRSFMWFIYGIVSTRSLPGDSFPVALTKEWIKPGTMMLTTQKNHHSWTVKDILPIGVPYLVYNSVIGKYSGLSLKERKSWPNPGWVFEGNYSPSGHGGFRAWRSADQLGKPAWQVPGYSEEQYQIGLKNWVKFTTRRLATRSEGDNQMLKRLFSTACEGLSGRVAVVNEALQYLQSSGGRCMNYATYDTYSSPNRDRRVFDDLMALRNAYKDIVLTNGGQSIDQGLKAQMDKIFPAIMRTAQAETQVMPVQSVTEVSACVVENSPGKRIDMAEFKRRLFLGYVSNNPHDDFSQRWGETRTPSARAQRCQSWDRWTPEFTGDF